MKPNLLFIVIDALRADKCFGEGRTLKTPNLDKMISNGIYFEQATTSVHGTVSSLGTLFSGSYSFKTGLGGQKYRNTHFKLESCFDYFKKNGYHQYAIVPKIVSHFGILKNIENSDFTYPDEFLLDEGLGEKIIKFLESKKMKSPWFLYVHLNDLHSPVICPNEYNKKKFGKNQYERMFSCIDYWLGKILKEIKNEETLILFTSDHGQNSFTANYEPTLLRKMYWKINKRTPAKIESVKNKILEKFRDRKIKHEDKNNLNCTEFDKRINTDIRLNQKLDVYDDVLRIPLLLCGIDIPKNLVISDQVNHIDVIPTIEDILKLKIRMKTDGVSLVSLFNNEKIEERPIYIESHPTIKESEFHLIGIRMGGYKYFRDIKDPKRNVHLYDLKKDPDEKYNIRKKFPEIISQYEEILLRIRKEITDRNDSAENSQDKDNEIENELRKLGYL